MLSRDIIPMLDARQLLHFWNQPLAKFRQDANQRSPFRQGCPEEFVLKHGQVFTKVERPSGLSMMTPKMCFANAGWTARRCKGWLYVEGFTFMDGCPMPVAHAWNCRPGTLEAVDRTCDRFTQYIGVTFRASWLKQMTPRMRRSDIAAHIDCWKLDWPVLRMTDRQLKTQVLEPLKEVA